jgi:hypothetical protein
MQLIEVDPPLFIEWVMILLSMIMALLWLFNLNQWPYLVLCASFVLGNATSIWVRTFISVPIPGRLKQATIVLLLSLTFSGFSFLNLIR